MSEDIWHSALLTRSEMEWLLGRRQLSKNYERKMRAVLNKKLKTWEQLERPLLEAHGFLAATISSSGATTGSSGIGHYPHCTVWSGIADSRVAPNEAKSNQADVKEYEKRMLRPGFEPGISDSKEKTWAASVSALLLYCIDKIVSTIIGLQIAEIQIFPP